MNSMTNKQFEQIERLSKKLWGDINNGHEYSMVTYTEFLGIVTEVCEKMQEEPLSEDLEEASKNYALNNTPWDDCKDEIQESFKAGARWQKTKDKSTTEDLGEYINELSKQFQEVSFAKLSRIAVRVAKWQMAQMIKNATEVKVHVDAGGYPYIPQIELYDYDKDIPLAKKGDKYKVILIKED